MKRLFSWSITGRFLVFPLPIGASSYACQNEVKFENSRVKQT